MPAERVSMRQIREVLRDCGCQELAQRAIQMIGAEPKGGERDIFSRGQRPPRSELAIGPADPDDVQLEALLFPPPRRMAFIVGIEPRAQTRPGMARKREGGHVLKRPEQPVRVRTKVGARGLARKRSSHGPGESRTERSPDDEAGVTTLSISQKQPSKTSPARAQISQGCTAQEPTRQGGNPSAGS